MNANYVQMSDNLFCENDIHEKRIKLYYYYFFDYLILSLGDTRYSEEAFAYFLDL